VSPALPAPPPPTPAVRQPPTPPSVPPPPPAPAGAVRSDDRPLGETRRRCAERMVARLLERTPGSAAEAERRRTVLCNNRRSLSLVRAETRAVSYPIRAYRSRGACFEDVD